MREFRDIVAVWLLYRCIAAGFAPIQWVSSSNSLRGDSEIGLLMIYLCNQISQILGNGAHAH